MDRNRHVALRPVGAVWISSVRKKYELTKTEAARMCCVTTATWNRWEKGEYPMNPCIFHYWLSMLERRVIPRSGLEGKRWSGWYIENGKLVTPLGERLSAASIESQNERVKQMRSVYRHSSKLRETAKNGLAEAGELWQGWKFKGGFLISPDERKIAPNELYVVMVGYDAMESAKHRPQSVQSYPDTDVIAIGTKCT